MASTKFQPIISTFPWIFYVSSIYPDGLFVHKDMRIEELLNVSHEGTDFSITRWHALYQGFNLNQVSFATEGLKDAQQPNMDLMGVSSKIQEKLGSSNDFPDDLHDDYCMSLRLLKLTWETSPKWMECLFLSNAIIKLITMRTLSCPRTNRADWSSTCSSSCYSAEDELGLPAVQSYSLGNRSYALFVG
ncbi:unnamed protein product [Brassica napus]|uniref:(rape) hypothetical protein n=1 Tax=Brassica napus TaxID=3708 RepID=A0A816TWU6_BRANA|nr:unnamed protein product [Brassica napus]